jgi:hypothetical protein
MLCLQPATSTFVSSANFEFGVNPSLIAYVAGKAKSTLFIFLAVPLLGAPV